MLHNIAVHNAPKAPRGREPIIRSNFDVYITRGKITYYQKHCSRETLDYTFFLYITPVAHDEVPPFSLFFGFWEKGGTARRHMKNNMLFKEGCLMSVPIPKYEIVHIRTGQWLRWEGAWPSDVNDNAATWSATVSEDPLVRSHFDIYLSGNVFIYTKESCAPSDTEATFFLRVYSSDKRSSPFWHSQYAFDNLDFFFSDHGKIFDDKCIAAVLLPRYDIIRIVSGQYTSEGRLWEVEFPLSAGNE